MADPIVKLTHVNKSFEKNFVVKDLCMDIYEGEFLTILGSSGCGKTTTLRMIAGFETPTSGAITIQGESVESKEPFERNVNTVFQNYALFPHMTIFDNIAFGLTMKKVSKSEIASSVSAMLELVQLPGFEKRKPNQLSGGQKQRVAIARALINRPKVLLLDEPLGALDLKLRKQMQFELKQLQKKMGITFVYVTHDQEEALTMSDRIAVMNNGILEQLGTPTEIYEKPASKFVADFIGESNIFDATIASEYPVSNNIVKLDLETGSAEAKGEGFSDGEIVYVSIRPEKMKMGLEPVKGFSLVGVVKEHIYTGSIMKVIVSLPNGYEVKINRMSGEQLTQVGEKVYLYWDHGDAVVMPSYDNKIFSLINDVELG